MTPRLCSRAALLASALLAALVALLLASNASAAVVACGQTITTDTELENDLGNCPGDGIVIGADGITLDLNGHTVDGVGFGAGVQATEHSGVTIENGAIQEFGVGIDLTDASNNGIRSNWIVGTFTGIQGGGLHAATAGNVIENNVISPNGDSAIVMGRNTSDITVAHNWLSAPSSATVVNFARSSGSIVRNRVVGGNTGIVVELNGPVFVSKNRVTAAQGDGISLVGTMAIVVGNEASGNGDDGIDVVNGASTKLIRNRADFNDDLGIEALSGVIDGRGNRASGNGNPLQCVGVACK